MLDLETGRMLAQSLEKHVERHADAKSLRRLRGSHPGYGGAEVAELAEQGWLALALPEEVGGMGLGLAGGAVVAEGLARAYSADPFLGLYLGTRSYVLAGGSDDLDALAEGRAGFALAWAETAAQWSDLTPETRFADGKLTGSKMAVVGLRHADKLLVSAIEGDDWVLAALDPAAAGVILHAGFRPDGSPVDRLEFVGCAAEVVAHGPIVQAALRRALDETSALVAAELMGHVDAMMALVLEHLKTRRQFGQTIGSFQALQHRAADMFVRQRLSRAVLETGLARLDQPLSEAAFGQQAARLRARLNDTAQFVMREAVQLFGAMGITDENDLSLHLKRCLSLIGWLGNSTAQRRYFMDLA